MKQLIFFTCLAVLMFALIGQAADVVTNFSGEWLLDEEISDPAPKTIMNHGAPEGGGRGGGGGGGMMGGGMMGGGRFPGAKTPPSAPPVPMVIQQSGLEIQITNTVNGIPMVETFLLNGKDVTESAPPQPFSQSTDTGTKKTKASWKKDSFTVQQSTKYPQSQNDVKKEYSLSKDGKTLTVKSKTTSVFVMGFNPVSTQTEQKQVYNKQ